MDRVTVVLPFRDRPGTLVRAVRSVLDQTHGDLQLLLVDDASSEDHSAVLAEIDDPRLSLVRLARNVGASAARNEGLGRSGTDLVAFMDSDDRWLLHKLERQVGHLRALQRDDPSLGVVGCGWKRSGASRPTKSFDVESPSPIDVLWNRVPGIGTPMLVLDRAVVGDVRFDASLPVFEDRELVHRCMRDGAHLTVVDEVLVEVERGRSDHLSNARAAARSYRRLRDVYTARGDECSAALRSWLAYRAVIEHCRAGERRQAIDILGSALRHDRLSRSLVCACGIGGGGFGIKAASRLIGQ